RQAVKRVAPLLHPVQVGHAGHVLVQQVVPADQRLVHHLVNVLRNEDRHQALTVSRKPSSANSLICSARLRMVFWSKTSPTMLRLTVLCWGACCCCWGCLACCMAVLAIEGVPPLSPPPPPPPRLVERMPATGAKPLAATAAAAARFAGKGTSRSAWATPW